MLDPSTPREQHFRGQDCMITAILMVTVIEDVVHPLLSPCIISYEYYHHVSPSPLPFQQPLHCVCEQAFVKQS